MFLYKKRLQQKFTEIFDGTNMAAWYYPKEKKGCLFNDDFQLQDL